MEDLTILMEVPAIPTEVSRDLPHTTPDTDMDMDTDMELARGPLSPATTDMVDMEVPLMLLSPDLCTPTSTELTISARGPLSLPITLPTPMDPDPATSRCQDPTPVMESMSTTARVSE